VGVSGRASSRFLLTWTLAVLASVCAFVVHLALRGKIVALGYELGRARTEQAQLREVKRVLELEASSYKTPERVEVVARTLLGMEPAPPDRTIILVGTHDEREAERPSKAERPK
jgi:hypothetical protein